MNVLNKREQKAKQCLGITEQEKHLTKLKND